MRMPTAVSRKSAFQIGEEWDRAADRRHEQIESRRDLSFWNILAPTTLELLSSCNTTRVLDVGCGTGELTEQIAKIAAAVVGVDVSRHSIELAQGHGTATANVRFVAGDLEGIRADVGPEPFTAVVAAMTLMTVPDLSAGFRAISEALVPGGHLVSTITHPCFWPRYWGYDAAKWFYYDQEIFIEAPFRISLDFTDEVTTHIHRPLAFYLNEAARWDLVLEVFREPVPSPAIAALYPAPWTTPRFAAFRWRKGLG